MKVRFRQVNSDHSLQATAAKLAKATTKFNFTSGGPAGMTATPGASPGISRRGSTPYKKPGPGIKPRAQGKVPAHSGPMQPKPAPLKRPRRVVDPKPSSVSGPGTDRSSVSHPTRNGAYIPRSKPR